MTRFSTNQQEHVEIQNGSDNNNNNNNHNRWRWFAILQMVSPEANTSCQVDAVSGHVGLVLSILSGCKSPMVVPVVAKLNSTTKEQKKQKAGILYPNTHIIRETRKEINPTNEPCSKSHQPVVTMADLNRFDMYGIKVQHNRTPHRTQPEHRRGWSCHANMYWPKCKSNCLTVRRQDRQSWSILAPKKSGLGTLDTWKKTPHNWLTCGRIPRLETLDPGPGGRRFRHVSLVPKRNRLNYDVMKI